MGPRNARQQPDRAAFLKAALNADCDGQAGLQELAGSATLLYYLTEEGREGKEAFWKSASRISASSSAFRNAEKERFP